MRRFSAIKMRKLVILILIAAIIVAASPVSVRASVVVTSAVVGTTMVINPVVFDWLAGIVAEFLFDFLLDFVMGLIVKLIDWLPSWALDILDVLFDFGGGDDGGGGSDGGGDGGGDGGSLIPSVNLPGLIEFLFVPDYDAFALETQNIHDEFSAKLPFHAIIELLKQMEEGISDEHDGDASGIVFDVAYGDVTHQVDLSSYFTPFIKAFRPIIYGLYCLFIAYYNYRQIMFLVRGRNYGNMKHATSGED